MTLFLRVDFSISPRFDSVSSRYSFRVPCFRLLSPSRCIVPRGCLACLFHLLHVFITGVYECSHPAGVMFVILP